MLEITEQLKTIDVSTENRSESCSAEKKSSDSLTRKDAAQKLQEVLEKMNALEERQSKTESVLTRVDETSKTLQAGVDKSVAQILQRISVQENTTVEQDNAIKEQRRQIEDYRREIETQLKITDSETKENVKNIKSEIEQIQEKLTDVVSKQQQNNKNLSTEIEILAMDLKREKKIVEQFKADTVFNSKTNTGLLNETKDLRKKLLNMERNVGDFPLTKTKSCASLVSSADCSQIEDLKRTNEKVKSLEKNMKKLENKIPIQGCVTAPNRVAFRASKGFARLRKGNTINKYQCQINLGEAFDASTGYFTAPVAGLYCFSLWVNQDNDFGEDEWVWTTLSLKTLDGSEYEITCTKTSKDDSSCSSIVICDELQQGEKFFVKVQEGPSAFKLGINFNGWLIH